MLNFLIKVFIKDSENVKDSKVRRAYGVLCSIYGIFINLVLFTGKYIAGAISGSVAIVADAFNNLTDAASSVITLIGFSLSGRKPDKEHPFGHGRIEYLAGMVIAALIITTGVELFISSVEKIISPGEIEPGIIPAVILLVSIIAKFYMYLYNKNVGKRIDSAAMVATATDSISDTITTTVVLVSMGICFLFKINIDGITGLFVALFIVYSGINAMKETLSPLLGQAPDPELVKAIEDTVMAHPESKGIHDLIVHDYGPGRLIISLHVEVDGRDNIFDIHDAIDNIEAELAGKFNCVATIHMDPIEVDNENVTNMRRMVAEEIKEINNEITIHDFRMVPGSTHTNLIFDAVLPADEAMTDEEAKKRIAELVYAKHPNCFAVVHIDRSYI